MIAYGLTAGLSFDEANRMQPGMVLDLFIYRRNYDDQQHGINREEKE